MSCLAPEPSNKQTCSKCEELGFPGQPIIIEGSSGNILNLDFKYYLEQYCKDTKKTLADIDIDVEDNSQMIAIITLYLGMKPKEVKMLFKSRRKSGEAWKLDQMAWVAKRCLIVKT